MKMSRFLFVTAIKICFVVFGIIPLVSVILFGALPTLPQIHSVIGWVGLEVMSGSILFLSYLAVAMLYMVSKNKARFSSVKVAA
ncbi:hypothetical protein R2083_08640 [Nitrosomonas sp. Is35]|uniref:hypothetical protein n=1 Tax=unclassified Nitrosomonas TaxID=2609265 RepID=UPI00294AB6AB|nr:MULTISPECIES: hypothetical protein [unclassified Nitrosomonas]MDV6341277.1 hypothetical protein [Nitrosomonas sp. Is24]MDV6347582.1 hypothetical protein [Nitrosomonas sp. Is35]